MSRKQVRIYQLYSRTTGKHVQILGKKINANGDDGGKYGMGELLCISPDTLDFLVFVVVLMCLSCLGNVDRAFLSGYF